ncbi:MAG: hypothetical protein V7776_09775 [Halopseudomonas aestusnigri]
MIENQVLGNNGVVSGEESQNVLLGQGAPLIISAPTAPGQVIEQRVQNGQQVVLDFDAASAIPSIEGSNFVLSFDGNGDGVADSKVVFLGMVAQAQSGDAPILIINGNEVSAGQLIGQALALLSGETLETAAGPTSSNIQSGGGSEYSEDTGESLTLLSVLGALASGTDLEQLGLLQGQEDLDPAQAVAEVVPVVVDTNDDLILTNIMQGDIKIPEWALLFNDTAADKEKLSVEDVSNPVNGEVSHDTDADRVTFAIRGESKVVDQPSSTPDPASFDYAAGDGDTSDSSTADIRFEDKNRLTGTSVSEIIVGDNVENEISGDFASGGGDVTGLVAQGAGDAIIGNSQDDHLVGDFAVYRQEGENSDDNFSSRSDFINSSVVGGDDRIQAGEGNDILVGDLYVDDDFGGDDANELSPTSLNGGDDYLDGGAGNDEISGDALIGDDVEGGSVVFTEDGPVEGRPGDAHILIGGADTLLGGSGEDVLVGDLNIYDNVEDGAHTLTGGNDNLDGGSDNDVLIGDFKIGHDKGEGSDPDKTLDVYGSNSVLTGGDDVLNGGEGNDTLTGDFSVFAKVEDDSVLVSGSDTFVFSLAEGGEEGDGHDTITDFESDKDILRFTDVVDSDGDGLDLDDLTAAIRGVVDDAAGGDVVVSFINGASITFEGLGTGTITSIDELVNDPANQIVIG